MKPSRPRHEWTEADFPDGVYVECLNHGAIGAVQNRKVRWTVNRGTAGRSDVFAHSPDEVWTLSSLTGAMGDNFLRIVPLEEVALLLLGA